MNVPGGADSSLPRLGGAGNMGAPQEASRRQPEPHLFYRLGHNDPTVLVLCVCGVGGGIGEGNRMSARFTDC